MKKTLSFVGPSREELKAFPPEVRQGIGTALYAAQKGLKHESAKPLTGNAKLKGVIEIVDDYDGDTYRCAYTAKLGDVIYVLHAFQKKSKQGKATPKPNIELIEGRLKVARETHKQLENESKKTK